MAFNVHPYGRPVIGTDENVRGFSSEKILGFYKRHYTPQNMILGVCGNISESELSRGLEDLFRFQLASPMHDPDITPEPAKTESVIATKSMEINATYLDIAFAAPRITHPDVPALDVLSVVAYRQPVGKAEIDAIRGTDSGPTLRQLIRLGLVAVQHRADAAGREVRYGTAPRFLQVFGLDSLDELPRLGDAAQV